MAYNFQGKTALITGAASGIGKATAQKLHSLGATLILCDINQPLLKQLQQDLSDTNLPPTHKYIEFDISSSTACSAVFTSLAPSTKINLLFNCAGINPTHIPITETTDAYFDKLVGVNLRGTYAMTRACIPFMPPGSAIVNVSSNCGLRGYAGFSVYCATKFAIVGLTKSLAVELGPQGIRVNAVAPGPTDTPTMVGNVVGGSANDELREGIGLGRLGKPEEVADVVAFLFSEGGVYMNGSIVEVHGGLK